MLALILSILLAALPAHTGFAATSIDYFRQPPWRLGIDWAKRRDSRRACMVWGNRRRL